MALCLKLTTLCVALVIHSLHIVQIEAQTESSELFTTDDFNIYNTTLPASVAEIVEAISNVQKNVTETVSKVPNIKVAGTAIKMSPAPPTVTEFPDTFLELFEPVLVLTTPQDVEEDEDTTTDAPKSDDQKGEDEEEEAPEAAVLHSDSVSSGSSISAVEQDTISTHTESESTVGSSEPTLLQETAAILGTPHASIFTFDGVSQWYNWATTMRDPDVNPEGALGWTTIISRGFQGLVQYYNPFRSFLGRALSSDNPAKTLTAIYDNRIDVIHALLANEILPNLKSITSYVQQIENQKVADRISSLSRATNLGNVTDVLNSAVATVDDAVADLLAPLDVPPPEGLDPLIDMFDAPFDTVLRAPFYVKFINLGLKALYVLIVLAFIPFSGFENFFLAPLPPEMDTYSGMLRFVGLQAALGPEYLLDYSGGDLEELDDVARAEVDFQESESDEVSNDYEDYSTGRRRQDKETKDYKRKDPTSVKIKNTKKEFIDPSKPRIFYNDLDSKIKPPPSRYGGPPPSVPAVKLQQPLSYSGPVSTVPAVKLQQPSIYGGSVPIASEVKLQQPLSYSGPVSTVPAVKLQQPQIYGGPVHTASEVKLQQPLSYGGPVSTASPVEPQQESIFGGPVPTASEIEQQLQSIYGVPLLSASKGKQQQPSSYGEPLPSVFEIAHQQPSSYGGPLPSVSPIKPVQPSRYGGPLISDQKLEPQKPSMFGGSLLSTQEVKPKQPASLAPVYSPVVATVATVSPTEGSV